MDLDAAVDYIAELLLADLEADLMVKGMLGIASVNIAEILRDLLVEDDPADGALNDLGLLNAVKALGNTNEDRRVQADLALTVRHDSLAGVAVYKQGLVRRGFAALCGCLFLGRDEVIAVNDLVCRQIGVAGVGDEHMLCALFGLTYALHGQVVGAEDHILSRNGYGVAVLRTQEVVCREHEYSCLGLRFGRQRNVDSHLVAVEVGVVCGTYQRMQLERAALNEDRLERLNAQTVQSRCAVEQHGVLLDDNLERVPNLGALLIDHLLCGLDVVCNAVLNKLLHDEGAEQLNGHFLGNAALIDLKIRADNDNATAGVVNTLAQQVLTETSLLALEHIRQRLECAGVCTGYGSAAAAVVDKCVNGFLKHALLVADNNVGRVELDKSLKTVIAVDNAAVQIVEVTCCKAAAVELNHGADLGRDDRQNVDYHPLGLIAALAECLDDLKALYELCLLLAGGVCQLLSELG